MSICLHCFRVRHLWSHLSAEYTVPQLPQGHSYGLPYTSATSNLCYCNTVAYSLFGACDACQGEGWFEYGYIASPLNSRWLMYLSLAGRNGMPTAQLLCLPRRQFFGIAQSIAFDILIGPQIPKPRPCGDTRSSMGSYRYHSTFVSSLSVAH